MADGQAAVQALQAALQALQRADGSSSWGAQASQVSGHINTLLQQHADVLQALDNKSLAERALRNVVANKEAEAARLRGEVQRLRKSQQQQQLDSSASAAAQTNEPMQTQTASGDADSDTAADASSRQAVLEAAVPAKEKPIAVLHQLQSEVCACRARIAALELELSTAAAQHNSSLAQQQKAFLSKLEQLRQVHDEQMAAAQSTAQKQVEQASTHAKQLESQLEHCKQQLAQQQDANAALRQELQRLQLASKRPPPSCQAGFTGVQKALLTAAPAEAPATAAAAAADGLSAAHTPAQARAAAAAEVAALQDMEAQLSRLSAVVKSYQGEREQLRQALMAGCSERQQLQQQVQELAAKLQAALPKQPQSGHVVEREALGRAYWGSLS